MHSITINPVAVAIDASAIQNYKSGVLPAKSCGTSLNHNVLAVAYDASSSAGYFTIKNSVSIESKLRAYFMSGGYPCDLHSDVHGAICVVGGVHGVKWSATWGEHGYIRLAMAPDANRSSSVGTCGCTEFAAYPVA